MVHLVGVCLWFDAARLHASAGRHLQQCRDDWYSHGLTGLRNAGFGVHTHAGLCTRLDPADMLELNTVFRERGYRKDMGVKGAVAVLFEKRFIKSKKAATSNWANERLTEAQLIYAANDAYAAFRVWQALKLESTGDSVL